MELITTNYYPIYRMSSLVSETIGVRHGKVILLLRNHWHEAIRQSESLQHYHNSHVELDSIYISFDHSS